MACGASRSSSLQELQEARQAVSFGDDTIIGVAASRCENTQTKILARRVAAPLHLMGTIVHRPSSAVWACELPARRWISLITCFWSVFEVGRALKQATRTRGTRGDTAGGLRYTQSTTGVL